MHCSRTRRLPRGRNSRARARADIDPAASRAIRQHCMRRRALTCREFKTKMGLRAQRLHDPEARSMAAFEVVPLRAFSDNYIWTIRDAGHAAVVDPGDAAPVLDYLDREKLALVAILNTHHHADHVGGNGELLNHEDVPVFGPQDARIPEVTHRLAEGERITLPHFGVELSVMEIPGHTRSHIAFHGGGMLYCGDTLFAAGCGRLFEGTPQQMYDSLTKLMQLPDATRVYCGHEYTLSNI